jgi:hypothetical protein
MFYVIEGFLDVILPAADSQRHDGSDAEIPSQKNLPSGRTSRQSTINHENKQSKPLEEGKHLFTVKSGGIAGYLCKEACKFPPVSRADPRSIAV